MDVKTTIAQLEVVSEYGKQVIIYGISPDGDYKKVQIDNNRRI